MFLSVLEPEKSKIKVRGGAAFMQNPNPGSQMPVFLFSLFLHVREELLASLSVVSFRGALILFMGAPPL